MGRYQVRALVEEDSAYAALDEVALVSAVGRARRLPGRLFVNVSPWELVQKKKN